MTNETPRFLQIHWLASFPATLLNRDDSGFAKRLPFGDAMRTRISSQCLKRHWRFVLRELLEAERNLTKSDYGVRSRHLFSRAIVEPLVNEGLDETVVRTIVEEIKQRLGFSKEDDNNDKEGTTVGRKGRMERDTEQAFMLGDAEIIYLRHLVKKAANDQSLRAKIAEKPVKKKQTLFQKEMKAIFGKVFSKELVQNLAAMGCNAKLPHGFESALFGRMVTSDIFANMDAAVHVAHAITVHPEATDSDYFTVVDDLAAEAGSAGLFDTELTAGLFYGYVVLDLPLLAANLGGDPELAGKVAEHLVHLVATVSPGAKKGSTAPYAFAETMLIESGRRQPRTLANAFRKPTEARIDKAEEALREHLARIDIVYGIAETRRHLALSETKLPGSQIGSLDELARFARDQARLVTAAQSAA